MSTAATISAQSSGTFSLGGRRPSTASASAPCASPARASGANPRTAREANRVLQRAVELGVELHRHRRLLRARSQRTNDRGSAASLSQRPGHRHQGRPHPAGPEQVAAGRPAGVSAAGVEMSLRRLKVERIDLWQLHRIDPKVPVEESLGAIKELQKQGKIRHVGLSEVKPAGDRTGAQGDRDRQRAEPVQHRRPQARRRRRLLREAQARLHPLVPGCGRQAGTSRRPAGRCGEDSTTRRRHSLRWRGCCIALPSCCRFRAHPR